MTRALWTCRTARADAMVIATEWPTYRNLDWAALRTIVKRPVIKNGRRSLPRAEARNLGYLVERIGDGGMEGRTRD
jgi:hypothetical protein